MKQQQTLGHFSQDSVIQVWKGCFLFPKSTYECMDVHNRYVILEEKIYIPSTPHTRVILSISLDLHFYNKNNTCLLKRKQ